MPRVKRGVQAHARHKKIMKAAKGYYGARSKVFRVAKQAVIKAGQYAYRDRRQKKRQFRTLWIARINAAARMNGLSYSRFMDGMKKAGVVIDRKVLAEIAYSDAVTFAALAEQAKTGLSQYGQARRLAAPGGGLRLSPAPGRRRTKGEGRGLSLFFVRV